MVFFVDMHMKHVTGNITQINVPMVDPRSPRTTSMFGINIPIVKDTPTMKNVSILNFGSGIKLLIPSYGLYP